MAKKTSKTPLWYDQPSATKQCCITGCYKVADRHHLKTRGAGGDDEHDNLLDLCREHHSEVHQIGWSKFAGKYPLINYRLEEKGWHLIDEFGVIRLRRKD